MTTTGRCLCGAIRYGFDVAPAKVLACHCADCRRQAAGPMMTAMVPRAALRMEDPEGLVRDYAASPGRARRFCGRCGTVLSWEAEAEDEVYVSLGALDPGHGLRLTKHIFTAGVEGYPLPEDGLPRA